MGDSGKGNDTAKGKEGSWGKSSGSRTVRGRTDDGRPTGPELERKRLTAEKFWGEIIQWHRKYGYILPSEPIDHPAANKFKDGKLWVNIKDMPNEQALPVGTTVGFHVYSDASGTLGCEEVES